MKTSSISILAALVVLGALAVSPFVPKLASAQTAIIQAVTNDCGFLSNTSCTPGVLHVYLQTTQDNQYNQNPQPSSFAATVSAQNSSPVSFTASNSGTNLSVLGAYSVTAVPVPGYSPTYSVGCTGSVINNEEATCLITESSGTGYSSEPVPYPYPYQASTLFCTPANQTVGLGQSATFSVAGNTSGPFNWSTPNRSYQGIGPVFSTTFSNTGTQIVTVSNSSQSATCTVNVALGAIPQNYISTSGTGVSYTPAAVYPSYLPPSLTITSSVAPLLPNTGFAPLSSTQVAILFVLLAALGLAVAPYVRKTFAAIG